MVFTRNGTMMAKHIEHRCNNCHLNCHPGHHIHCQPVLGIGPNTDPVFSQCWGQIPLQYYSMLVLGICPTTNPIFSQTWRKVPLQTLLLAFIWDRSHYRYYYMLVQGIQVPLHILFSPFTGDRSQYRSYFQLVLGIGPTTDPIFSQSWGQVPLQILFIAFI